MSQKHSLAILIVVTIVFVLSTKELRSTSAAGSLNDAPFAPVAVDDFYTVHNQMLLTPMANDYNPDPYGGLYFNAIETIRLLPPIPIAKPSTINTGWPLPSKSTTVAVPGPPSLRPPTKTTMVDSPVGSTLLTGSLVA